MYEDGNDHYDEDSSELDIETGSVRDMIYLLTRLF